MNTPGSRTALITGASSGLGATFARHLAVEGYNLVLVARRLDRLEALASELAKTHNVQAEPLIADLADPGDLARLESRIDAIPDLHLLVNNAGFGLRERFSSGDLSKHLHMIDVHILATVRLTHRALPGMLARKSGAVINVASVAAFVPIRNVSYSATKAYLVNFSQALHTELAGSGVRIQALCPGFVYTEFHDTPELERFRRSSIPKWMWLQADDIVTQSLKDLRRGRVVCVPSLRYKTLVFLARSPVFFPLIYALGYRFFSFRNHSKTK